MADEKIKTVLYLRSTKNRKENSIDWQRQELLIFAKANDYIAVGEYVDDMKSGQDIHRDGFSKMVADLKSKNRVWNYILVYDTSRISRDNDLFIPAFFKHECQKTGVKVRYKTVPIADPATEMLITHILQSMDVFHSMQSREKGIGGMKTNLLKGFRAGGVAPIGYELKQIETGEMREGKASTKTKLVVDEKKAPKIALFLERVAAGEFARVVARELDINVTNVASIKRRALVYAGHTVWNMTNERVPGKKSGYKNGIKYRSREEWVIIKNTHESLISEDTAELLLSQVFEKSCATKLRTSNFLLTGLLEIDGMKWETNTDNRRGRKSYRLRSNKDLKIKQQEVERDLIENAVLKRVRDDFSQEEDLVESLFSSLNPSDGEKNEKLKKLNSEIGACEKDINKLMDLLLKVDDSTPFLSKMEEVQATLKKLEVEREGIQKKNVRKLSRDDIRKKIKGTKFEGLSRLELKSFLKGIINKIELNDEQHCQVHYKLTMDSDNDRFIEASPRGVEPLLLE